MHVAGQRLADHLPRQGPAGQLSLPEWPDVLRAGLHALRRGYCARMRWGRRQPRRHRGLGNSRRTGAPRLRRLLAGATHFTLRDCAARRAEVTASALP